MRDLSRRARVYLGASYVLGLVASCPRDGQTAEVLLREADLAAYTAKREGRDRVVVAGCETRELAAEWARVDLDGSARRMPSLLKRFRRHHFDVPRIMTPSVAPLPLAPSSATPSTATDTIYRDPVRGEGLTKG